MRTWQIVQRFGAIFCQGGVRGAVRAIVHFARRQIFKPNIVISRPPLPLETLGSAYGGWTFFHASSLCGSTIISCGAGEDISFDVAIASRYRAHVVIVDPTPRAVAHVTAVLRSIGRRASMGFLDGGRQPIEAYDLSGIGPDQLSLLKFALWIEQGAVKFFPPADPDHVSHSIVDLQGTKDSGRNVIEVPAITLSGIMDRYRLTSVPLLKLDIEGAEIEVLPAILQSGLRPHQILVEFDGLNFPSLFSRRAVLRVDAALREAGYVCYHTNGQANFLYARPDQLVTA